MQIDEDDIIYRRETRERSSIELVVILAAGIIIGTLVANGLQFLVVTRYAEYKLEQAARLIEREVAEQQSKMQEQEKARMKEVVRQQEELRRNRIQNSDECRFWTEMNERNPSQKSSAGVNRFCAY